MKYGKDFNNYLYSYEDKEYKTFNSKIINTKYKMIGIRVPIMRKIAKEIIKDNYQMFLESTTNKYYEEIFIEGLVIASLGEEALKYVPKFIKKIDDWAICDSFCKSLTFVKKNKNKYFDYFKDLALQKEEYVSRVGLITFLSFYVEDLYLEKIFKVIDSINSNLYYVNMAIAWLLAECYIKYPDITLKYLKKANINKFTFNKTISKICDSYRVDKDVKEKLKEMRKK